jgi:hypothetical protein
MFVERRAIDEEIIGILVEDATIIGRKDCSRESVLVK